MVDEASRIPIDEWKAEIEDEVVALESIFGENAVTTFEFFTEETTGLVCRIGLLADDCQMELLLCHCLNYPLASGALLDSYGHPRLTIDDRAARQTVLQDLGKESHQCLGCPSVLTLFNLLNERVARIVHEAAAVQAAASATQKNNGRGKSKAVSSTVDARLYERMEQENAKREAEEQRRACRVELLRQLLAAGDQPPSGDVATVASESCVVPPQCSSLCDEDVAEPLDAQPLSQQLPSDASTVSSPRPEEATARDIDAERQSDQQHFQRLLHKTQRKREQLRARFGREKDPGIERTRRMLPAADKRQEIINLVDQHQVVVISGKTGCGKTTQVPQFLLDDWIERGWGAAANIIMTQPRRLPTLAVSERIAKEIGTKVGQLIGYQIQLERKTSASTRLCVCTTGILLQRLRDPRLSGVTHVIVDEVHERDLDTDFLLMILRELLPRRPTLRLILMSATISGDTFAAYFGQNTPVLTIPGRTFPVQQIFLESALHRTGYIPELTSYYCRRTAPASLHPAEATQFRTQFDNRQLEDPSVLTDDVVLALSRLDPQTINYELIAIVTTTLIAGTQRPRRRIRQGPS